MLPCDRGQVSILLGTVVFNFLSRSQAVESAVCNMSLNMQMGLLLLFKEKSERIYRPSEHPPVRGGKYQNEIIGCKGKTSSWHLIGFPDAGGNIRSTV